MNNKWIKPAALIEGDLIAIAAPSSTFDHEPFLQAVERLKSWGFAVHYNENIFRRKRYLAGSDNERAQELIHFLQDPKIKAILTARGGYGAARLLPYLDVERHSFFPKILLGYSDFTAIHNYFNACLGWTTFQGPCLAKDFNGLTSRGELSLIRALSSNEPLGEIKPEGVMSISTGVVEGVMVGGCLSLVCSLVGTPYQLDTSNKIFYLEDVGEKPYRIDRMLLQLRYAGMFKDVLGIVIGPLKNSHEEKEYLADLIYEWLGNLKVPIIFNFPSGHVQDSLTIPFGVHTRLDADKGSLTFLESALI